MMSGEPAADAPPPELHVALMSHEWRADVLNLTNASDSDRQVRLWVEGLPGGTNPGYVAVHEVQHVGTRPEARRRGLALQLLKHALHVLVQGGANAVECEVYEDNVAAAKLAASFGMEPKRRRVALAKELD